MLLSAPKTTSTSSFPPSFNPLHRTKSRGEKTRK